MNMRAKAAGIALLLAAGLLAVPNSQQLPALGAITAAPITISGVDSHDGMIFEDGGQLYWVGTRYGCGFAWQNPATPWCGFGVWTAPELDGPWTFIRELFSPGGTSAPAFHSESWQTICRGDGCFNPRMHRRADGVWLLWFNAPRDQRVHGANQFWSMGCNGPAGPCGTAAGTPYGGTFKPSLWVCNTGGDFSILDDAGTWYLYCGTSAHTISVERLASWGGSGTGVGAQNLAGLSYVEGTGVFRLPTGQYVITYGGNCPYCSATDTSYAMAATPMGPFLAPWVGGYARRVISPHSCGGQSRSIATIDGRAYQLIDHWYDSWNETNADTSLIPLIPTGLFAPVDGARWPGGFATFDC